MHFLTGMFANLTILKEKNEKVTNAANNANSKFVQPNHTFKTVSRVFLSIFSDPNFLVRQTPPSL
jgi:hypothetical protein